MKLFSAPALLAAALLSAVVGVPFLPVAQNESGPFFFEVRLTSTQPGIAQLYFDTGSGFSESASSRIEIGAGGTPRWYRLGFPSGTYRALRFDPINRPAALTMEGARVRSASGRIVRAFAPADFQAANQIDSARIDGNRLELTTAPNANDPILLVSLTSPMEAKPSLLDRLAHIPRISLVTFALLGLGLLAFDRMPRWRAAVTGIGRRAAERPKRALPVVALVAVVLSAYPVVFLGKSLVSPNLGTILLYDAYPTLPGYGEHKVADVQLSDVGAIMWQHVPFSMIQHRALLQGELPLWNRYTSAGTPLLGQGQSMFGDPLHFLVIAANGAAWAWDLKYLVAKWLFAVGLGVLVLEVAAGGRDGANVRPAADLRPGGAAVAAAMIVAATAPFIGFFLYRLNHPAYFSVCYAPWPLYCWIRAAAAPTRRTTAIWAAGLIVANLALMTSGTAKEAYMLLLTMNLAGACVLAASAAPWRAKLLKFAGLAWAGILFALLTAPIWATFHHTLRNAYTSYNAASAFQLQPAMLLGLFDEVFFRPLMVNERVFDPSLNFLLLLGLLYFLATLRGHFSNRAAIAVAACSLVPLSLAFGLVPPQWIVRWPILANVAHLDNTFGCALIVLWAVLAGAGFAQAARRLGRPEGRGDLVIVGLLLFALVFGWIAFRHVVHRPVLGPTTFTVHDQGKVLAVSPFIWGYLAALLAASVLLLIAARRALVRTTLSPANGLLIALCVVALSWRHALHAPAVGFRDHVQQPTERVDFHARSEAVDFVRAAQRSEPGRGFGLHGNFFPGWTAVYGLETVHGPDAIMSPCLRELMAASGIERMWDWRLYVAPEGAGAARPFLDALNVRWYLDLASDQGLLGRSLRLAKVADLDVYESPTAWPRAFFTDRVLRYSTPAELVQRIRESEGRPLAAVQSTDPAAQSALASTGTDLRGRTVRPAAHYRLTENTTSFDVHADGPGVVVLTETWWPGDFRAELNGKSAPVLRFNHAFKGVAVPAAGDYTVTFRYWPQPLSASLAACGAGVLLLGVSLWGAMRRTT